MYEKLAAEPGTHQLAQNKRFSLKKKPMESGLAKAGLGGLRD